jgi:tetratricopeptide (TPR) repeat protein/DNA-binding SARP family transcriptional activator
MQFLLLGDFRALDGDFPVQIKSMQVRALLVTLLLAPGQRASHDYIAARLWPDGGSDATNIRSCSRKLRTYIPEAMPEANERGYCSIRVDYNDVDYLRFWKKVKLARIQRGQDQVGTLNDALAEWDRDREPLTGITGADLSEERERLGRELRVANHLLLQAMFRIGLDDFGRELRQAQRRWPADEWVFRLELQFLARRGSPSQVRGRFDSWTREYGAPSQATKALVEKLVRRTPTTPLTPGVPRQLPPYRASLVGRRNEFAELSNVLLAGTQGGTRLAVVSGLPGIGKTELAQQWAASMEENFPDGTLYVNLHGYTAGWSPDEPPQILARFLSDLGLSPRTRTVDGMTTAFRTELARRRAIVILDNARDAHQVRPLLPGSGSSVAIVTSRDRLMPLIIRERAHEVRLAPLDHADSVTLLGDILGTDRMRTGAEHVNEIVRLCGGLPLALSVVAARTRLRRADSLGEIAVGLRDERTRLDSLRHTSAELNVRAALGSSHGTLSSAAVSLLSRLAVHPGPTISRRAVMHLAESFHTLAVDELVEANLLDEPEIERYSLHDLVRSFAAEHAAAMPGEERDRIWRRVSDFLLHNTWACDRLLAPERELPIGGPGDVEVVAPATPHEAMAWLDSEYDTVTGAIRQAHEHGDDRYTWLLSMALTTYQWRTHRYADAERYLTYASAAERPAGPGEQAMIHRMLAGSRRGLGKPEQAKADLRRAISLSEAADHPLGAAHGRHTLGLLHRESGETQIATELFESALSAYRLLGDRLGEAGALRGLGTVRFDLGDHDGALLHGQKALRLFLATDDVNSQASTLMDLGRAYAARRAALDALESFTAAADRYARLHYPQREASALVEMSEVLNALNRVEEARSALLRAADLLRDLHPAAAAEVDARLKMIPGGTT